MPGTLGGLGNCNEQIIEEGCLVGGQHYVVLLNEDGTVSVLNQETGAAVNPADIVVCDDAVDITETTEFAFTDVFNTQAAILPLGTLSYWYVKAESLPVTITVNGTAHAMQLNEQIAATAQDGRVLTDTVLVTVAAGGRAQLVSTRRIPA
jgi:hypothetical protein